METSNTEAMKYLTPIIALALFTGCAKEDPEPPYVPQEPQHWSRQAPQPISPNGITVQGNSNVVFTWSEVPDADNYQFSLRRITNQGDTVGTYASIVTATQQSVSTFYVPSNTQMIWRVKSMKGFSLAPHTSEWSEWATFVRVP
jgi:hypothetical protein